MKLIGAGAIAVAIGSLLIGCGNDSQQDAPEPTPDNIINGTNTRVIQMPEGFRNLAVTCDGTTALYVTSRGWVKNQTSADYTSLPSSVTAVPNSEHCVVKK